MNVKLIYSTQEARKVLCWLIALELMLVSIYIVIHIWGPDRSWGPARALFDLDGELSIPSWFSSLQLFVISSVLFIAALNNRRKHHLSSSFLFVGGLLFIFLSADEGAAIHEKLTGVVRKAEMTWLLFNNKHGAWITIYSLLMLPLAFVGARYFRMMWSHFRRETLIALGGSVVFVMGAVGFEIISYLFLRTESTTALYRLEVLCEEFLEMLGASIILYAVLLIAAAVSAAPSRIDSTSVQQEPFSQHPAPYAPEQTRATVDGQGP